MTTITLDQIQQDIAGYLRRVAAGETLLVMDANRPLAEIKPAPGSVTARQPRPVGLCAGEFRIPDDFDAPLPDDVLRAFEGQ